MNMTCNLKLWIEETQGFLNLRVKEDECAGSFGLRRLRSSWTYYVVENRGGTEKMSLRISLGLRIPGDPQVALWVEVSSDPSSFMCPIIMALMRRLG